MKRIVWTRKKFIIAIAVCAILAGASVAFWQLNQTAQAAILEPYHEGLVGWWRFDEESGTSAEDSSGYGNDGTVYGAPAWVDGIYNKALSFDGLNDYVQVSSSPSLNPTSITLMAWIRVDSVQDSNYEYIVRKRAYSEQDQGTLYGISMDWNSRNIKGFVWTEDYPGCKTVVGSSQLNLGEIYHVCFTYATGDARIYLNGTLDKEQTSLTGNLRQTNDPLRISDLQRGTLLFNGLIDEVRIYNRALTETEIQESFSKKPDFSSEFLAKIPKGTTQVFVTISWEGTGDSNVIIETPVETFTEEMVPVYQKTSYSTSGGTVNMLNIKRLSITVTALDSEENWHVILELDNVEDYSISVEIQK